MLLNVLKIPFLIKILLSCLNRIFNFIMFLCVTSTFHDSFYCQYSEKAYFLNRDFSRKSYLTQKFKFKFFKFLNFVHRILLNTKKEERILDI